jgi:hypothetical protein
MSTDAHTTAIHKKRWMAKLRKKIKTNINISRKASVLRTKKINEIMTKTKSTTQEIKMEVFTFG